MGARPASSHLHDAARAMACQAALQPPARGRTAAPRAARGAAPASAAEGHRLAPRRARARAAGSGSSSASNSAANGNVAAAAAAAAAAAKVKKESQGSASGQKPKERQRKRKETSPRRRQRAFYEDASSGMQQLAIPSESSRTNIYSFDVSGARSGLHRSPVSGGVASASHTHRLPSAAVAVRNLMEQARYGQLCTLMSRSNHRRAGYPFGSVVDFVVDAAGLPIFALSPLAIHTRNLMENPRSTIVVQMPGWHGMANARVTLFGDISPVAPDRVPIARECFRQKHDSPKHQKLYANSDSFQYFHFTSLHDVYFVGGFGTVTWVDVKQYFEAVPDPITGETEATLRMLNDSFREAIVSLFANEEQDDPDSVNIITIDQRGVDLRLRYGSDYAIRRLCFDEPVDTPEQAAAAMQRITTSQSSDEVGLGGIDVE